MRREKSLRDRNFGGKCEEKENQHFGVQRHSKDNSRRLFFGWNLRHKSYKCERWIEQVLGAIVLSSVSRTVTPCTQTSLGKSEKNLFEVPFGYREHVAAEIFKFHVNSTWRWIQIRQCCWEENWREWLRRWVKHSPSVIVARIEVQLERRNWQHFSINFPTAVTLRSSSISSILRHHTRRAQAL